MNAQPERVELALSGSNVTGDVPFSCALAVAGNVTHAAPPPGARGDLASLVAQLCEGAGVSPERVGTIRVDVGPGSYTGLRVALTFVRFLQRFGAVQVLAYDSLALLAARAEGANGRVHAVLDARRGRFHAQGFLAAHGTLRSIAPPAATPLENALAGIGAGDVVVVPEPLVATITHAVEARGATLRGEQRVLAGEMFARNLPCTPASFADLEPRYLMGTYVED